MEVEIELVVAELLNQVAQLSKEKSINAALATQYKREMDRLISEATSAE